MNSFQYWWKATLFSFLIFSPSLVQAQKIAGIEEDKYAHAFAGFTGQVICEAIAKPSFKSASPLSRSLGCFLIVTAAGVAKEMLDPHFGGTRETGDVIADVLGAGLAIPVIRFGF